MIRVGSRIGQEVAGACVGAGAESVQQRGQSCRIFHEGVSVAVGLRDGPRGVVDPVGGVSDIAPLKGQQASRRLGNSGERGIR